VQNVKKSTAVLDTNIVVSAIFWRSEAYRCLVALARRQFLLAGAPEIFEEYREVAARVKAELKSKINPAPILDWMEVNARSVEPVSFVSRLSRDAGDNMFVGCALAANAAFIVTQDRDLLSLEKPFGIQVLRPRPFLRKLRL
jgi:uncharacterized protein